MTHTSCATAARNLFATMLACAFMAGITSAQNFTDVKPSPQQVEWQDLEFGVLIHYTTNTFLDREWGDGTADPKVFNPTDLDAEQWVRAAQAAGAKYVVLVAKHHDGFCLWPTEQTDYSVKNSPWRGGRGDLVREVSDAAKKYGLKFGVYLSPWDRHEPRYKNSAEYDDYYSAELHELITNYGNLTEFWLDGAGSGGHVYNFPGIIDELRIYQPNALVFADVALFEYGDIRWVGNEDGTIPYENWNVIDRHGYLRWRPVEADTPLHKSGWFWHPNNESTLKTTAELVSTYDETIGRGGQLMLGLAPDRRGLLPDADVKRLQEFGAAIHQYYGQNLMEKRIRTHDFRRRAGQRSCDVLVRACWFPPRDPRSVLHNAGRLRSCAYHGEAQQRAACGALSDRNLGRKAVDQGRRGKCDRTQANR